MEEKGSEVRVTSSAPKKPTTPPSSAQVATLLGRTAPLWEQLHADLTTTFGPLLKKWSYSAKTERWSVQLKESRKKRTILYAIPCSKHFIAAFALGEKACAACHEAGLPDAVLGIIEQAPRYPEGRGVWLEVHNRRELEAALKVAAIKMAN
jgi:hypothetical protein